VGKTTTLAKLAAYLKIKRQLELGIVSLDTYRIGAVDQLQTYAGILDVPFSVAQNKTELDGALDDFKHCDAVLIDTTGRNYLNREHVKHLCSLFHNAHRFNHFLVLSASAKDEDLRQTIVHFRQIDINSFIFTKLDETVHHGCMLNQLLRFNYPISYMGTGQRVPEDIEPATQKRLLSFLLPAGN
jgi:flagellar biosynthesis protein FlhF